MVAGHSLGECVILPEANSFLGAIFGGKSEMSRNDLASIMRVLQIGHVGDSGHSEGHSTHVSTSMSVAPLRTPENHASRRLRRSLNHANVSKCFSMDELLLVNSIFGSSLNPVQFSALCPSIIQQQVHGACHYHAPTLKKVPYSNYAKYGYAVLAVFIISITSGMGLMLMPLRGKPLYGYCLNFLVALAIGTLVSDAMLHLIPLALGVHSHSNHHGVIELGRDARVMLVGVASIYMLFVLESFLHTISKSKSKPEDRKDSNFSELSECVGKNSVREGIVNPNFVDDRKKNNIEKFDKEDCDSELNDSDGKRKDAFIESNEICCTGFTNLALMLTLGDIFHNVADGIAVGAAFSINLTSGISTSIAVLCHEIPHEIGDFAVLLSTGLSWQKAILLNLLAALSAFVGLFVGLFIASHQEARTWIFIITGGMFLYVSLSEMLPELIHGQEEFSGKSRFIVFILQNLGIMLGIGIMTLISIFEQHIVI